MYISSIVLILTTCCMQDSSATDPTITELITKIGKLDFPNVAAVKAAGRDYNEELNKYKIELDASVKLLAKRAPTHPDLPRFLVRRWEHCDVVIVAGKGRVRPEYWLPDIAEFRKLSLGEAAVEACDYQLAYRKGWAENQTKGAISRTAREFIHKYPRSQYIEKLLMGLVAKCTDRDDSIELLDMWLENLPEDSDDRKNVIARRRLWNHVGETIELKFTDELSGADFDLKDQRGKVVVIEFWSTTCPPCISHMRNLKAMDESSEFDGMVLVGIANDAGDNGRKAMRKMLDKEGISWPQYFQDSAWDGPFSTEMGIRRLPTTILVDKQGKLRPICEHHMIRTEVLSLLRE